jgi:hypothetical protein
VSGLNGNKANTALIGHPSAGKAHREGLKGVKKAFAKLKSPICSSILD